MGLHPGGLMTGPFPGAGVGVGLRCHGLPRTACSGGRRRGLPCRGQRQEMARASGAWSRRAALSLSAAGPLAPAGSCAAGVGWGCTEVVGEHWAQRELGCAGGPTPMWSIHGSRLAG